MRKFMMAVTAALMLVVGGFAAGVSAQTQTTVELDSATVAPGGTITVFVENGDPGDDVLVTIVSGGTASGVVGADGNISLDVTAPTTVGGAVGTVEVGTDDFPITFNVVEGGATTSSTTTTTTQPAATTTTTTQPTATTTTTTVATSTTTTTTIADPTAVNTGDGTSASNNATTLFVAAAALFLVGIGAMGFRRRSIGS